MQADGLDDKRLAKIMIPKCLQLLDLALKRTILEAAAVCIYHVNSISSQLHTCEFRTEVVLRRYMKVWHEWQKKNGCQQAEEWHLFYLETLNLSKSTQKEGEWMALRSS